LLILFSLIAVPEMAIYSMNKTKGHIINVSHP